MHRNGIGTATALILLDGKDLSQWIGGREIHVPDFLSCVKTRARAVSDFQMGFFATVPCALAIRSVRENRAFTWDAASLSATSL